MALNINGTTGISGVDGSASAPALTGTDANTGINFGADVIDLSTGGSSRFKVGAAGQLGIAGANYGTAGQALLSQGASAAPQWGAVSSTSPTETYAHVTFGNTYDSNSGYVKHNITAVESNGITGDTTNDRLTPTVAGFYLVMYNANWSWPYTGGTTAYSAVYKNGSQHQRATFAHGSYSGTGAIMVLIGLTMNGTSDYVEFFGYENRSNATAHMTALSRAAMFLLKAS